MPEWASPIWLLGLLLLPLIRWLHRRRLSENPQLVSALYLWPAGRAPRQTGHSRLPPSPWWLLRALLFSLLMIALADPYRAADPSPMLHIWLDTHVSMQTHESDGSRLQQALRQLPGWVSGHAGTELVLHPLTDPQQSLLLPADFASRAEASAHTTRQWVENLPASETLPLPAQFSANAMHWLITDGVRPGLQAWLRHVPVTRILSVGSATDNSGILLLSLRPALSSAAELQGELGLYNSATKPVRRNLVLRDAHRVLQKWQVELRGRAYRSLQFKIPASSELRLQAEFEHTDSLAGDDRLRLQVKLAKFGLRLDPGCDDYLRAALRNLTALQPATGSSAPDLFIGCSRHPPETSAASIWFMPAQLSTVIATDSGLTWASGLPTLDFLQLQSHWLRRPGGQPGMTTPLLRAGADVVLAADRRTGQVTVALAEGDGEFQQQPEFPLFIAGLVEHVLGVDLQDPIYSSSRPLDALSIAPRSLSVQNGNTAVTLLPAEHDSLRPQLILLALILMLVDVLLGGRSLQARSTAEAGSR